MKRNRRTPISPSTAPLRPLVASILVLGSLAGTLPMVAASGEEVPFTLEAPYASGSTGTNSYGWYRDPIASADPERGQLATTAAVVSTGGATVWDEPWAQLVARYEVPVAASTIRLEFTIIVEGVFAESCEPFAPSWCDAYNWMYISAVLAGCNSCTWAGYYAVDSLDAQAQGKVIAFELRNTAGRHIPPGTLVLTTRIHSLAWAQSCEPRIDGGRCALSLEERTAAAASASATLAKIRGSIRPDPDPQNQPPVAAPDAYAATTGQTLFVPAPGLLANDMDPDGDSLTAYLDQNTWDRGVWVFPDGSFRYQSYYDIEGPLTFTYYAYDGVARSEPVEVTLNLKKGPRPDLVVSSLQAEPASPREGDAVTVRATIANAGTALAQETWAKFYVDGVQHGPDQRVDALEPGKSQTITVPWVAVLGSHTLRAEADVYGSAKEVDETNNARDLQVSVAQAARPDLVVSSLTASPAAPREGETVTFAATVSNIGDASAGAFVVRFLVDGNLLGGDVPVSGLAVGASTTVSRTWTAVVGSHTIRAEADAAGAVAESDETNNAAQTTVQVAARPVYGVAVSPASQSKTVAPKGSAAYAITITNTGSAADTILLSKNPDSGGWKTTLGASSVTLAPGATATVQLGVTAPNKEGTFMVTVTAKSQGDPAKTAQATATTTSKKSG